ncbi:MAG: chorismate-binding protein [Pseudobdellovibrionaceae bacterium]
MLERDFYKFLTQGAILRRPNGKWLLFWDFGDSAAGPKSHLVSIFYNTFDLRFKNSLRYPKQVMELTGERMESLFRDSHSSHLKHFASTWTEPSENSWKEGFDKLMERLVSGELKKAVPVVFATNPETPSVLLLLQSLAKAPPSLFPYGIWSEKQGMVGATPEILFHRQGTIVRTMALAGTWAKSAVPTLEDAKKMLRDPKEISEHRYVVDDICSILHPLGIVKTNPTEILELPKLWHLKTEIQLRLTKPISDEVLISYLHPTPALGLSPRKSEWKAVLRDLNPENTESFGAPFGMISKEEAFVLVSIRNVIWNEFGSRVGSGCGVVKESQCENEWLELRAKRESVMNLLDLRSGSVL